MAHATEAQVKKIIVLIILFPAIALADAPMSTALGGVVELVAYGLGLLLATLLSLLAKKVSDKFKVSIPEKWMDSANALIDKGISYAEEKSKQAIKNNETINGNEKLNLAAGFVLSMADDKKLIKLGEDKLKKLIEARLGQNRVDPLLPVAQVVNINKDPS